MIKTDFRRATKFLFAIFFTIFLRNERRQTQYSIRQSKINKIEYQRSLCCAKFQFSDEIESQYAEEWKQYPRYAGIHHYRFRMQLPFGLVGRLFLFIQFGWMVFQIAAFDSGHEFVRFEVRIIVSVCCCNDNLIARRFSIYFFVSLY